MQTRSQTQAQAQALITPTHGMTTRSKVAHNKHRIHPHAQEEEEEVFHSVHAMTTRSRASAQELPGFFEPKPKMLKRNASVVPEFSHAMTTRSRTSAQELPGFFEPKPKMLKRNTNVAPEFSHRMATRSQPLYEVEIDFDEASRAWRANKRRLSDGNFVYTRATRNSSK